MCLLRTELCINKFITCSCRRNGACARDWDNKTEAEPASTRCPYVEAFPSLPAWYLWEGLLLPSAPLRPRPTENQGSLKFVLTRLQRAHQCQPPSLCGVPPGTVDSIPSPLHLSSRRAHLLAELPLSPGCKWLPNLSPYFACLSLYITGYLLHAAGRHSLLSKYLLPDCRIRRK